MLAWLLTAICHQHVAELPPPLGREVHTLTCAERRGPSTACSFGAMPTTNGRGAATDAEAVAIEEEEDEAVR